MLIFITKSSADDITRTGVLHSVIFMNIRTYSEAVCATIGSIMGIPLANGRNLMPSDLNKEDFFFWYNSPPYHILVKDFIPKVAPRWRKLKDHDMFRKGKKRSGLKMNELGH